MQPWWMGEQSIEGADEAQEDNFARVRLAIETDKIEETFRMVVVLPSTCRILFPTLRVLVIGWKAFHTYWHRGDFEQAGN